MPYSIFFRGGYAVHGSYEISRLGRPASHGCVRLHPKNAAVLFALVKQRGANNTRIVVTGTRPSYRARRHRSKHRTTRYRHRSAAERTYTRRRFDFFGPPW